MIDLVLSSNKLFDNGLRLLELNNQSERCVVVITGRCQRLNRGSSTGARTISPSLAIFNHRNSIGM